MTMAKAFTCLTKIALPCLLALAPLSAQATISNAQAKAIIQAVSQDYRTELLAHSMPFRIKFDENRKKPTGMFAFLDIGRSAHIDVENRILKPGATPTPTNVLKVSGYFPSLPAFTTDVFAMVICHEVGHVIGGAPLTQLMADFPGASHSIEGQADYFAAAKCFKRWAKNHPRQDFQPRPEIWNLCMSQHSSQQEGLLCARTITTAEALINAIKPEEEPVLHFTTGLMIDTNPPVQKTVTEHPGSACRLRTLAAGALCSVPAQVPVSLEDPAVGLCEDSELARRPHCWYAR